MKCPQRIQVKCLDHVTDAVVVRTVLESASRRTRKNRLKTGRKHVENRSKTGRKQVKELRCPRDTMSYHDGSRPPADIIGNLQNL